MHGEILPRGVAVRAVAHDIPGASLFPEEEEAIGRAVERRRREFTTGRACARAALAELGVEPCPIPAGPRGAPRWPAGIVGSITHCAGYRACAAAWESELLSIGIDAEPADRPVRRLRQGIATQEERRMVRELMRGIPEMSWELLLFCAKEAVFKAWFPLTGRPLGYRDAIVALDPTSHEFSVRIGSVDESPAADALGKTRGRWLVRDGILLTAVAAPAS